jgi:hypothetical protein
VTAIKLSPPQIKLLARLPEFFSTEEDFRHTNTPRTVVRNEKGAELFRFGVGDARTFDSLRTKGVLIALDRTEVAPPVNGGSFIRFTYGRAV